MDRYLLQYILYFGAFVIVLYSQIHLQSTYQKARRLDSYHRYTGAEVARMILDENGLSDVQVVLARGGSLSDHYNPVNKTVNLSSDIYFKSSVASISVAAHEVGHAIQHKEHYGAIALRNRILPFANLASQMGWGVLFLGFIFSLSSLIYIGIFCLMLIALFQLVTLPVEFNASSRALVQLQQLNIIVEEEVSDCRKMLSAAALTYVAALLSTLVQILRLILIFGRNNED